MKLPLLSMLLLAAAPAAASVTEGVAKWRAGDWNGAVAEWVAPAARGDADALFNLGQAYKLGRGVPQNLNTAQDYYRRAADKGHLAATANLGITLYQQGRKAEALNWLRTAADRGDARAAYVLGVASFNGDGAPRNQVLGYAYMLRAREAGLQQADPQAARMAVLLTPIERGRGEAAAAALAAGEPVPVELLGRAPVQMAAAQPADGQPAGADTSDDGASTAALNRAAAQVAARPTQAPAARPTQVATVSPPAAMPPRPQVPAAPVAGPPAGTVNSTAAAVPASVAPVQPSRPAQAPAAQVATSAPARPAPAPAKTTTMTAEELADAWLVQLGAYNSEAAARTAWATLVAQQADVLVGSRPIYNPRGGLVRLQVGPFDDRGLARDLCAKLSAAGRPCFVTRG